MLMVVSSCLKYRHFAIFRLKKKFLKRERQKKAKNFLWKPMFCFLDPDFGRKAIETQTLNKIVCLETDCIDSRKSV